MAERPGAFLTVQDLEKIAGGDPRQIVDSVSYTHLTLPTIYSV